MIEVIYVPEQDQFLLVHHTVVRGFVILENQFGLLMAIQLIEFEDKNRIIELGEL